MSGALSSKAQVSKAQVSKAPSSKAPKASPFSRDRCPRAAPVAVLTVVWNAEDELEEWARALSALDPPASEIVAVDCNSHDGSAQTLERIAARLGAGNGPSMEVISLSENVGFTGGFNRAFRASRAELVLSLNADARPSPDYLERLMQAMGRAESMAAPPGPMRCGSATGRLTRLESEPGGATLDACGMRLTPTWRHKDRGSGKPDRGQYSRPELVFGGTGAATLFSRRALIDVALPDGSILDEDFHSFREDAELAFRLQERGWHCVYEPSARCLHRRVNTPATRARMPASVNMHSLKNRYLLRCYHQSPLNFVTTLVPTAVRDIGILLWVLVFERTSLDAYRWLLTHRKRLVRRRRWQQSRQNVGGSRIERWFWRRGAPIGRAR